MINLIIAIIISMIISLQPKQKQLLRLIEHSNYENIAFGGARGGAKSHAIRDIAILLGIEYNIPVMIFRRYSQELLDNHIYPIERLYPELRKFIVKSPQLLMYNPKTNIPMIRFAYAEHYDDILKLHGSEYVIIFVDESTQCTQEMREYLATLNRYTRGNFPSCPKIVDCCNPGGVGHGYIKRIYVDKQYIDQEKPESYSFIQAHVWDNVAWVAKRLKKDGFTVKDYYEKWTEKQRIEYCLAYSDYAKRLSKLPEQLRKAYLWGDWDVFGGMFFEGFDRKIEIIPPFEIPKEWFLVGSMDPGFASPLSFGLQARDPKGDVYRICTYYEKDTIPNHAKRLKELMTSESSYLYKYLKGRMPDYIVAGHDAFAKLDRHALITNESTVEDYFRDEGIYLQKAMTDRVQGWWVLKSLMPDRYFIFEHWNEPLVKQFSQTMSDPDYPEDIEGRGRDINVEAHALDDARYGAVSIYTPGEKEEKKEEAPEWFKEYKKKEKEDYRNIWANEYEIEG